MRHTVLFLLLFVPLFCDAQSADSLFILEDGDGRWVARYRVQNERNVFELAKKFGVPSAMLADVNRLSYAEPLASGSLVKIPLTTANWYNYGDSPANPERTQPLFFRITEAQSWFDLSRRLGVRRGQLCRWNGLLEAETLEGRPTESSILRPKSIDVDARREVWPQVGSVIAVGWISLDNAANARREIPTESTRLPVFPDTTIIIADVDTLVPMPALSPMEQAFQDQTSGGAMVTTEKGPAAFFPAKGGTVNGVHYAFHNTASRGSVVRVHNIGTGRTVYVKVLGPLPKTRQYAGAIIGISAGAKAGLGVRGDTRAFCELSYAGY